MDMAELEAQYEKDGVRKGWVRALGPGTIKLGRESGKADLVVDWDLQISRCHALLTWADDKLQVRRVVDPKPTINPILYQNVVNDDFTIIPGEQFIIGDTVFRLRLPGGDTVRAASSPREVVGQIALPRDMLRQMKFQGSGKRQLEALAVLPQLLQEAHESVTDELLETRVAEVLLEGTPYADAAAVV